MPLDMAKVQSGLEKFYRDAPELTRRIAVRSANALVGEAQTQAPVRTGFLAAQHVVDDSNPSEIILGANARYAAAVHERHPTKRHWFSRAIIDNRNRIMGVMFRKLKSEFEAKGQVGSEEAKKSASNGGGA